MRRLSTLALCALALAGCDDGGESPSESPTAALVHCGSLEAVVLRFGGTIAGPYLDATLSQFRFREVTTNQGSIFVRVDPPVFDGCSDDISRRLEAICVDCAAGMSVENCLLEVEAAFATPSQYCVACGDGRCSAGEDRAGCPADCRCGDGTCDVALGELPSSCPTDCPSACGNGVCESLAGEVCACPDDAPDCTPCARDCCVVVCGDGSCDAEGGESLDNCEQDCGLGTCGDGRCMGDEDVAGCADCLGLPPNCSTCPSCFASSLAGHPVRCGDGVCAACEPLTCRVDCTHLDFGVCTIAPDGTRECPPRYCGDGTCEGDENYLTCPGDCVVLERLDNGCESFACELADEVQLLVASVASCRDAPLCPSHCGDGYCQGSEVPLGVNAWDDPCAEDCGFRTCPAVDYLAYCAAGVAGDAPRCDTFELAPGNIVEAVVDCTRPCPIVDACSYLCDDSGATPVCDVCPVPLPDGAVHCDPQSPWSCFNDETGASVLGCAPHQPELAGNGACWVVSTIERCPNGCDPHRAECKP